MSMTAEGIVTYAKGLLSDKQAQALGRAVFATALLGDGHVAMVHIIDYRRGVGVSGVYGPDAGLDFKMNVSGKTLPLPNEIEKLIGG